MITVRFSKLARQDVESAADWYDDIRPGLGDEFLLSLDAVLQLIRRRPAIGSPQRWNTRRKLMRRFPYAIFYRVHADRIDILGAIPQMIEPEMTDQQIGP